MVTPGPAYAAFLDDLEVLMVHARQLGLYRTTALVHEALNEARSEQFEAAITPPLPTPGLTVDFAIGPVREQTLKRGG